MSGVYIKGMKMPKTCRKCGLKMNCDDCEGWECYCLPLKKNIGYMDDEPEIPSDKRRDDCPLIPVPDHGRLIDADAFEKENAYFWGMDFINAKYEDCLCDLVNAAPTIIPADFAKDTNVPTKAADKEAGE